MVCCGQSQYPLPEPTWAEVVKGITRHHTDRHRKAPPTSRALMAFTNMIIEPVLFINHSPHIGEEGEEGREKETQTRSSEADNLLPEHFSAEELEHYLVHAMQSTDLDTQLQVTAGSRVPGAMIKEIMIKRTGNVLCWSDMIVY
ncbi:hypothetical protein E2C01_076691 [Portunus trituberculatus]|uniref:Uncharacterized protein n=1 Tax=Portunus trituberculatus TaxID=210409 RepID=A0A5B7IKB6_PORTR|nr:hypothetical protein [Portunus trituberculatus]